MTTLLARRHYNITGIVQGVGFRPFIYRLAHESGFTGWVRNSPSGVEIELQGNADMFPLFEHSLADDAPPLAVIDSIRIEEINSKISRDLNFSILPSAGGEPDVRIAPDSALCPDCLRELFDPLNRRYRYPFITCTNCGPRYSIITGIPYDRRNTTMANFPLCAECLSEYENPLDRRFHAQPIACHDCGPQTSLLSFAGEKIAEYDAAVLKTVELLRNGAIIAVKGIGGYHLSVDACNHNAVARLRERKKRDEKPFAIMVADLEAARSVAKLSDMEGRLLSSPEAPIVIVEKRLPTPLSPLVSPNNGWFGIMLPYTPLHHLLFSPHPPSPIPHSSIFKALVMTSGNISDEPVAFEDADAIKRLAGIADYFLLHDRPIHIRSDDSVMRVFQGRPLFYRRARGYAPRAVILPFKVPPLLAAGAELKNTFCLATGNRAVLSQHIGNLQNQSTLDSFGQTVAHLSEILVVKPTLVACDLHPDYLSSRFAEDSGLPMLRVQHHHAHLASCMAENGLNGDVIGIIFDGTGYGTDGTVWGGEFLVGGYEGFSRAGHFCQIPLPGGDAAVREPWRMAMAYLYQALGEAAFEVDHPVARYLPANGQALFAQMLRRGINSPLTSSCGRLFDAVAALLNLRHTVSYDGQGAIELEALAEGANDDLMSLAVKGEDGSNAEMITIPASLYKERSYSYNIVALDDHPFQLDFLPMFTELLADLAAGIRASVIALRFHKTVVAAATELCLRLADSVNIDRVIFSGGVFQNRLLSEMLYTALSNRGLTVFTHRLVPPNDGGIALGQAAIAGRRGI